MLPGPIRNSNPLSLRWRLSGFLLANSRLNHPQFFVNDILSHFLPWW